MQGNLSRGLTGEPRIWSFAWEIAWGPLFDHFELLAEFVFQNVFKVEVQFEKQWTVFIGIYVFYSDL